jgi:hypothetical protein
VSNGASTGAAPGERTVAVVAALSFTGKALPQGQIFLAIAHSALHDGQVFCTHGILGDDVRLICRFEFSKFFFPDSKFRPTRTRTQTHTHNGGGRDALGTANADKLLMSPCCVVCFAGSGF